MGCGVDSFRSKGLQPPHPHIHTQFTLKNNSFLVPFPFLWRAKKEPPPRLTVHPGRPPRHRSPLKSVPRYLTNNAIVKKMRQQNGIYIYKMKVVKGRRYILPNCNWSRYAMRNTWPLVVSNRFLWPPSPT